jgi:hypothetical protein
VYVADARTNLNTISCINEHWFQCGASEICWVNLSRRLW